MLSFRFIRLLLHVVEGFLTTILVFPLVSPPRRNWLISRWSQRLLRILHVSVLVSGTPPPPNIKNSVFIANHISWLDMFLLHAIQAMRFVSKAEVRRWPLVGRMVANSETLFIERGKRSDAKRINSDMLETLGRGERIAFFPEGTTSDGTEVRNFHASLLQAAIIAKAQLWPVAIRYRTAQGAIDTDPAYTDVSFSESLKRILKKERIHVELSFLPPLNAADKTRRELAAAARTAIVDRLNGRDSSPEKSARLLSVAR